MTNNLPTRQQTATLLKEFIKNQALIHHCEMVAQAMQAYAQKLGEDEELWYQVGLLHDLDYDMFPDKHPHKAIKELLADYPQVVKDAVSAHAPGLTGREPQTLMEKYLFACDELSGLMHAVSLMRPSGFGDMKPKSVKKKIKDKSFATKVSRADIQKGFKLIGVEPDSHIAFLIEVFNSQPVEE
ncbi:MAG: HD domain-containing protein [Patescibacteria group bacterium]